MMEIMILMMVAHLLAKLKLDMFAHQLEKLVYVI